MAIYPGAVFKPTAFGGKTPRNRQGRGMLHVAVSRAKSLPPSSGTTWHFYVALAAPDGSTDGSGGPAYCEQYVDTEYRAYGGAEGNDDQLIVETAGGTGTSRQLNAEPWTRAQELRIADLMRWEAGQPDGAPIALLPDARPGRRGWGPHRLGIKHSQGLVPGWWFPGCELWSNAIGKECPGDAKVAQVPHIVTLAAAGAGTPTPDLPNVQEDSNMTVIEPDGEAVVIVGAGHTRLRLACDFDWQRIRLAMATPSGFVGWPGSQDYELAVAPRKVSYLDLPKGCDFVSVVHLGADEGVAVRPVTVDTCP